MGEPLESCQLGISLPFHRKIQGSEKHQDLIGATVDKLDSSDRAVTASQAFLRCSP